MNNLCFSESGLILKPCAYGANGIKMNSDFSDRLPMRKTVDELVKFLKKFQIEKMRFQVKKYEKY